MSRSTLTHHVFNQSRKLTVRHQDYADFIEQLFLLQLKTDLGRHGDLTSQVLFNQEDNREITAHILSKEAGLLAGLEEVSFILAVPSIKQLLSSRNPITCASKKRDGDSIKIKEVIVQLKGTAKDILRLERLILNLLQRMSGLATYTKELVKLVKSVNKNVLITSTRKTLWGFLDKKAVSLGGGGTHRLNLSEAILIKDNHKALHEDLNLLEKLTSNLKNQAWPYDFLEIEVDHKAEARQTANQLNKLRTIIKKPIVIMFDNLSPSLIKQSLDEFKKAKLYKNFLFEASGGINSQNIIEYAKTGVDVISLGALTMPGKNLDMSLEIEK